MRRRPDSRRLRNDEMRTVSSKQGHSYVHSRHLDSHSESRSSSSRRHELRHHSKVGYHSRDDFDRSVGYDDRSIAERNLDRDGMKRSHSSFSGKNGDLRSGTVNRGLWHLEELHRPDPESFAGRQMAWSPEPPGQWRHRRSYEMDDKRHRKRSRSRSREEPQDARSHAMYPHGDSRPGWRRSPSPVFNHPFPEGREVSNIYNDIDWHDAQPRQQHNGHPLERFDQWEHINGNTFREVLRPRSRTPSPFRARRSIEEVRFRPPEEYVEAVSSPDRPFMQNVPVEGPSSSHYRGCDPRPSSFNAERCAPQNLPNDRCYREKPELLPNIRQMVGGLDKYISSEQNRSNDIGLSPAQKARARKLLEELLITVSGNMPGDVPQVEQEVKVEVPAHPEQRPIVGNPEQFLEDANAWRSQEPAASSAIPNVNCDLPHYPPNMGCHHPPYNVKEDFKPNISRSHRSHQRRRV